MNFVFFILDNPFMWILAIFLAIFLAMCCFFVIFFCFVFLFRREEAALTLDEFLTGVFYISTILTPFLFFMWLAIFEVNFLFFKGDKKLFLEKYEMESAKSLLSEEYYIKFRVYQVEQKQKKKEEEGLEQERKRAKQQEIELKIQKILEKKGIKNAG